MNRKFNIGLDCRNNHILLTIDSCFSTDVGSYKTSLCGFIGVCCSLVFSVTVVLYSFNIFSGLCNQAWNLFVFSKLLQLILWKDFQGCILNNLIMFSKTALKGHFLWNYFEMCALCLVISSIGCHFIPKRLWGCRSPRVCRVTRDVTPRTLGDPQPHNLPGIKGHPILLSFDHWEGTLNMFGSPTWARFYVLLSTLKTKSWSRLVTICQMGLKNESQLVLHLVTWGS